jgi:hypothetical protein
MQLHNAADWKLKLYNWPANQNHEIIPRMSWGTLNALRLHLKLLETPKCMYWILWSLHIVFTGAKEQALASSGNITEVSWDPRAPVLRHEFERDMHSWFLNFRRLLQACASLTVTRTWRCGLLVRRCIASYKIDEHWQLWSQAWGTLFRFLTTF